MHTSSFWPELITLVVLFAGILGVFWVTLKSSMAKKNEQIKSELIDNLTTQVDQLKQKDADQQRTIDSLSQDVEYWKKEPIRKLSDNYDKMVDSTQKTATAISEISDTLKELSRQGGTR